MLSVKVEEHIKITNTETEDTFLKLSEVEKLVLKGELLVIQEGIDKNEIPKDFSEKLQNIQIKNSGLADEKRLEIAGVYLETPLSKMQKEVLLQVHEMSNNTQQDKLAKRAELMKNEVFSKDEAMILLRSHLAGKPKDVFTLDLEKITVMLGEKKIAEGSLVNSDNEIAVKINKVIQ